MVKRSALTGQPEVPETYVGYQKAENFASPGGGAVNTRHVYTVPPRLRLNQWAFSGEWTVKAEAAVLHAAGGRIAYPQAQAPRERECRSRGGTGRCRALATTPHAR